MSVRHVRGQALDGALNPIADGLVECWLNVDAAVAADVQIVPLLVRTITDSSGYYFLDLDANTDFAPTGTTWTVRILKGSTSSEFSVSVTDNVYPPGQLDAQGNPFLIIGSPDAPVVAVPPIPGGFVLPAAIDFSQPTPAAQWGPIQHNFHRNAVLVAAFDSAGNERSPQVQATDPDNIVLYFNDLVAGSARCM